MQASLERLRARREELDGEGGFTLIELLIVIVILAILAAIVVFAVSNLTGTSAQSACKSDYKTVESASEAYKAQVGVYPGITGAALTTAVPGATDAPSTTGTSQGVKDLLGTVTIGANTFGPWLKDNPINSGHYQISVTTTDSGKTYVEQVYDTGTTPAIIPTGAGTGTQADCSAVK